VAVLVSKAGAYTGGPVAAWQRAIYDCEPNSALLDHWTSGGVGEDQCLERV